MQASRNTLYYALGSRHLVRWRRAQRRLCCGVQVPGRLRKDREPDVRLPGGRLSLLQVVSVQYDASG
jgi:hypothetical protein